MSSGWTRWSRPTVAGRCSSSIRRADACRRTRRPARTAVMTKIATTPMYLRARTGRVATDHRRAATNGTEHSSSRPPRPLQVMSGDTPTEFKIGELDSCQPRTRPRGVGPPYDDRGETGSESRSSHGPTGSGPTGDDPAVVTWVGPSRNATGRRLTGTHPGTSPAWETRRTPSCSPTAPWTTFGPRGARTDPDARLREPGRRRGARGGDSPTAPVPVPNGRGATPRRARALDPRE